jgi:protein-S-isoprenylcysteine O-methyltransferase Ste14
VDTYRCLVHLTGAVRGVLVATSIVWVLLELRQSRNYRPEAVAADKGSRFVLQFAAVVGVAAAIRVARATPATAIHPAGVLAWIGLGILWCGIALRLWSFRTLGRYFTFTVQTSGDQPVITTGPYRLIRHPSYAGILLAVMGLSVLIGNWLSVVSLTAVVACGLAYRITVEERALLRDLGDNYRDYAATRRRLVPFIW